MLKYKYVVQLYHILQNAAPDAFETINCWVRFWNATWHQSVTDILSVSYKQAHVCNLLICWLKKYHFIKTRRRPAGVFVCVTNVSHGSRHLHSSTCLTVTSRGKTHFSDRKGREFTGQVHRETTETVNCNLPFCMWSKQAGKCARPRTV